ncbi:MAG: helix-turn-helix domain-containing protein [Clostridiales bacterium]|nr:helix-turn-helix domain-containing protein [Clostridiales bacterium]
MATIGEQIKEARKAKGMTQEALASLLNMSRQGVSHWESGRTLPDAETLLRLSGILDYQFESETPSSYASEHISDSFSLTATPASPAMVMDPLLKEKRKTRVLWIVLTSVLCVFCAVFIILYIHYHKTSDIHMEVLETPVYVRNDTQLLGDLSGWEFTLSIENRSDIAFTPDRITLLVFKDQRIYKKAYVSYSEMRDWMDSDKLRKGDSPLHWLFAINKENVSHAELVLQGRDDNGHTLEFRLTVPLLS